MLLGAGRESMDDVIDLGVGLILRHRLGEHVDELLDGMDDALRTGRWQPNVDSESRRVALLPETVPQPWDELMLQPAYRDALGLLN